MRKHNELSGNTYLIKHGTHDAIISPTEHKHYLSTHEAEFLVKIRPNALNDDNIKSSEGVFDNDIPLLEMR